MVVTAALPTRSRIQAWGHTVDALSEAAAHWRDRADWLRSSVDDYVWRVAAPGGTQWEGQAAAGALAPAQIDRLAVYRAADHADAMADIAERGADALRWGRQLTLADIAAAEDDEFTVAEDLSVADNYEWESSDDYAARLAQAQVHYERIAHAADRLQSEDHAVAAQLDAGTAEMAGMAPAEWGTSAEGSSNSGDSGGDSPHRRWTDEDLYPHDPTAADVNQDLIGDCYFDSTMGAIANANPQWIKDRIRYDDTTGNFDITLWDGNQWKHIPVTQDDIETDIEHSGASWLDNGQPNGPLWPAVLESAYAKLKAPGDNLGHALKKAIGQGGQPKDAMQALTGNRGKDVEPQSVWLTRQHLDQEITSALGRHQPVTMSTTPNGEPLHKSHTYIVESITGTGSDAQVTLRNPWNSDDENPLITVRLGDVVGSGVPDIEIPGTDLRVPTGTIGAHPTFDVNIGALG